MCVLPCVLGGGGLPVSWITDAVCSFEELFRFGVEFERVLGCGVQENVQKHVVCEGCVPTRIDGLGGVGSGNVGGRVG